MTMSVNCNCIKQQQPKDYALICKEEYDKCPKKIDNIPIHGHKWPCKLCAKLVNHYHCGNCYKIIKNDFYITNKIIIHQGKTCIDYCQ